MIEFPKNSQRIHKKFTKNSQKIHKKFTNLIFEKKKTSISFLKILQKLGDCVF